LLRFDSIITLIDASHLMALLLRKPDAQRFKLMVRANLLVLNKG